MREFFWGWKRKVGVVTLLLACVLICGFLRSTTTDDWIFVNSPVGLLSFTSTQGVFRFTFLVDPIYNQYKTFAWHTGPVHLGHGTQTEGTSVRWVWHWIDFGFDFGYGELTYADEGFFAILGFPYWTGIVLTFLSGWLLLSKPRPKFPKPSLNQ